MGKSNLSSSVFSSHNPNLLTDIRFPPNLPLFSWGKPLSIQPPHLPLSASSFEANLPGGGRLNSHDCCYTFVSQVSALYFLDLLPIPSVKTERSSRERMEGRRRHDVLLLLYPRNPVAPQRRVAAWVGKVPVIEAQRPVPPSELRKRKYWTRHATLIILHTGGSLELIGQSITATW